MWRGILQISSLIVKLQESLGILSIPSNRQGKDIHDCLEDVNLWERHSDKVKTLSGGMIRRLGVAQALLGNPELILVDYAVKLDLISSNPADKIERPKKERFMANFYDADEVNRLFEISKGTKLEIPILFGAFYGMRRSETLGMKWDAIDFERDTITIRHTLTTVALDGKRITVAEDRTKNKSSMRTLPLVPFVKERLLELKAEQEENRRLCGRSYVKDYTGYVCINEIGDIIKPNYVSCGFPKLLEEHGLRRVRYHDLRHSCASLLLANGVPMKQIQEWLGHSDFSTTANIYAHLEYSSKVISADAMLAGLGIGNRE